MYILIPISILILAALLMITLRLWRPNFGYHWLIAASGAFSTWLVVLFIYTRMPENLQVISLGPGAAYTNSIILSLDQISWPFAAAISTLLFATLISDVVRAYELSWSNWVSSLLITAIALLGIFSRNLLTFIMVWIAYDLIVLVILLLQLDSQSLRRRSVRVFFFHILGALCLMVAGVLSVGENNSLLLEQPSPPAMLFILLAAGIRFGALPIDSQMQEGPENRRSFGTVRSLASMAIVSILLVRVAGALQDVDLSGPWWSAAFFLVGLTAFLFSFVWLTARDELGGRQAWIMGLGMLIIASSMRAELNASLAWGLAAIFSGGLLFLASVRIKISMWLTLIGVLGIRTIPFTASWSGLGLFTSPISFSLLFYFAALVMLLAGYARYASQSRPEPSGLERWIRFVYPLGLVLLPLTHLGIGLLYLPDIGDISLIMWLVNLLIIVMALLLYFWLRRGVKVPVGLVGAATSFLSYEWLRSAVVLGFGQFGRFLRFSSSVLEGEGGVLWVMLSIVLFLAVLLIRLGI